MIPKMLHIILRFKAPALLCMVASLLWGCEASFTPLYEYDKNNGFLFDAEGKIIKLSDYTPPVLPSSEMKTEITGRGEYEVVWKDFTCRGNPGDRVFPIYENGDRLYLLTEKDSDHLQLMVWDRKRKTGQRYPPGGREAENIIISPRGLHGIQYAGEVFSCNWFTPGFHQLDRKLKHHYRTDNLFWRDHSPDGKQWIVELFFRDKPSLYVLCEPDTGKWREISQPNPYKPDSTQKKEIYHHTASDGEKISGVLSFPPLRFGRRKLPLIVFPHGGPQTRSMPIFDPRVEQLNRNGFLVFQPNYRGSTGQGKRFRQAGWKAGGIRRALADIADGTNDLIRQGFADPERTAILGGSWGAYCALASAALYPDLYRAAIAFFGPSDLPAMLGEFLSESCANPALDQLQFGDVKDPATVEELKKISPFFLCENIRVPILIYHFEQDQVISFEQSEKFYHRMKSMGKTIHFIHGPGGHCFPDSKDEAEAYERVIRFLNEVFSK